MNNPSTHSEPQQSSWKVPIDIRSARQSLPRPIAVMILKTSLAADEIQFSQRFVLSWLAAYPGDLPITLLHAETLILGQQRSKFKTGSKQAVAILESVLQVDPEYREALELILKVHRLAGQKMSEESFGNLLALGGALESGDPVPAWAHLLKRARISMENGDLDTAESLIHQVLLANPSTALAALTHLRIETKRSLPLPSIRSLAELYHERWPTCVQLTMILADSLMDSGEPDRAVALLHQAAAQDVIGQVATRLWGSDHPYRSLWPAQLEVPVLQELSIPASVASILGWNQLLPGDKESSFYSKPAEEIENAPASQEELLNFSSNLAQENGSGEGSLEVVGEALPLEDTSEPEIVTIPSEKHPTSHRRAEARNPIPESLKTIQEELEQIAGRIRQPHLARADGRFPVYVIFTTRKGLEDHYGAQAFVLINNAMKRLADAVRACKSWDALVYYADEGYTKLVQNGANLASSFTILPAKPKDAWSLKLALIDLDTSLAKQGEMIGAVLIVGGPEVIPFHHLPNPVDDADVDVPSDNPYGTRDENYFIPEWPVGRLPGGTDTDAEPLLHSLMEIADHHLEQARGKPWYSRWLLALAQRFMPRINRNRSSLGYTAAIWKQASLTVYHPVGEARSLLVSPPLQSDSHDHHPVEAPPTSKNGTSRNGKFFLHQANLGYYNLHGLQDASEWYGQKDPSEPLDGPDYPVALRPDDIGCSCHTNNGHSPQFIFTEACYGANIIDKKVDEAIALKFLASGSLAVVGSTCTAYGSIASPLAAADLIGFAFWNYLSEGLPAGEALRRAKIHLAREMHQRQGYLDGEDQKTMISFVLYGDPLARSFVQNRISKGTFRSLKPPAQVKTICDRSEENLDHPIQPEVLIYVKHVVSQYLPGMVDACFAVTQEHVGCPGGSHQCPTAQLGAKSKPSHLPARQVVTLSKTVEQNSSVHHHYARLTLDAEGKLVKLVVSR